MLTQTTSLHVGLSFRPQDIPDLLSLSRSHIVLRIRWTSDYPTDHKTFLTFSHYPILALYLRIGWVSYFEYYWVSFYKR